tara:strand:+ start:118 stop:276 length:159 start_codon:yes stop_codon:yes gene_type:complete
MDITKATGLTFKVITDLHLIVIEIITGAHLAIPTLILVKVVLELMVEHARRF